MFSRLEEDVPLETLVDKARVRWILTTRADPVGLGALVPRDLLDAPPTQRAIKVALPVSLETADDWNTDFWDPYDSS